MGRARQSYGRALEQMRRAPQRGRRRVEAACAVEFGPTHRLHLHAVVLHDGIPVDRLAEVCRRSGFGHVHVRTIGRSAQDRAAVAAYWSKSLQATAVELHRGRGRVAPATFSRGWQSITDS
ncbi:hypothetical protein [Svornostia abyssi]